jgi:hypothetical protein
MRTVDIKKKRMATEARVTLKFGRNVWRWLKDCQHEHLRRAGTTATFDEIMLALINLSGGTKQVSSCIVSVGTEKRIAKQANFRSNGMSGRAVSL